MLNEKLMDVLCEYALSMNWKASPGKKKAFSFYVQISLRYSDEMKESPTEVYFHPNES